MAETYQQGSRGGTNDDCHSSFGEAPSRFDVVHYLLHHIWRDWIDRQLRVAAAVAAAALVQHLSSQKRREEISPQPIGADRSKRSTASTQPKGKSFCPKQQKECAPETSYEQQ